MDTSRQNDNHDDAESVNANPRYGIWQLASAFKTSQSNPDAATRKRADEKIRKWISVLDGMLSGRLTIGSRTPLARTPAWATLEVVKGGFATGDLLAEGPLQQHETELLARFSAHSDAQPRAYLNRYYLSDQGISELQAMLRSGCYRVNVPEEGILLTIAWLLEHDHVEAAWDLLDEVEPYLDRIRFYPVPHSQPQPDGSFVYLRTIGQTVSTLAAMRVSERIAVQRETTLVWAPLQDRIVELFLETVNGGIPSLQADNDGKPTRNAAGRLIITGGWPCQDYPGGWPERAQTLLNDYERLRIGHRRSAKPDRQGENFALLRGYLKECIDDPTQLSGRDVGQIRSILAHIVTRRGVPNSKQCRGLRKFQNSLANRPANAELAQVVIDRLTRMPQDEGLSNLEAALAPVSQDEATQHNVPLATPLFDRLDEKVRRCLMAPVAALVEHKVITSAEVIAQVTPQITAQVSAAGLVDPTLRRLYQSIYQAFRRRRSLLLLNLDSQVKLAELPWVQAINRNRTDDTSTQELARKTLEQITILVLTSFPHQILPNKLLQELRSLAAGAGLDVPLVDELAADIFTNAFSNKFLRAAQLAGLLLSGSLYEQYYSISYSSIVQINDGTPVRNGGPSISLAFYQLCSERAGQQTNTGASVASNGKVIAQEQILTTHNLASLVLSLGLEETLRPRSMEMGQRCFIWVCRRQQQFMPVWKARMQMVKNTAYAWRQMIFFLSFEDEETIRSFVLWAEEHLDKQHPGFQKRFAPVMDGLRLTVDGTSRQDGEDASFPNARRFLGWSTGTHWLLASDR